MRDRTAFLPAGTPVKTPITMGAGTCDQALDEALLSPDEDVEEKFRTDSALDEESELWLEGRCCEEEELQLLNCAWEDELEAEEADDWEEELEESEELE